MDYWVILYFPDTNENEIAPYSWLEDQDKVCRWPSWKNSTRLITAVKNQQPPDRVTWKLHPCRIIGNKKFATYESARKMLNKSIDTSDLSEAELGPRKSKKRQRDLSSDSDSDFSDSRISRQNVTPTSTKTPLPAVPLTLVRSSSTEVVYQLPETSESAQSTGTRTATANELSEFQSLQEIPTTSLINNESANQPACNSNELDFNQAGIEIDSRYSDNNSNLGSSSFTLSTPRRPLDGNYEKLLAELQFQSQMQQQLNVKVDKILNILVSGGSRFKPLDTQGLPNFPMTTKETLKELSDTASVNPRIREKLVEYLKSIGGVNSEDGAKRQFSRLLSDELCMQVTWCGTEKKMEFRNTIYPKVMLEALTLNAMTRSGATEEIIERLAKSRFKNSSDKIKLKGKRQVDRMTSSE